ncbi:hypothetical protein LJR290_007970 [Variovorax sp. LjRoot290]|uniref:hypothetical protein n=1 Tax=Variovorax sp. LjRoot290 TaxID=3342316 RepID=UPI003ECE715B
MNKAALNLAIFVALIVVATAGAGVFLALKDTEQVAGDLMFRAGYYLGRNVWFVAAFALAVAAGGVIKISDSQR